MIGENKLLINWDDTKIYRNNKKWTNIKGNIIYVHDFAKSAEKYSNMFADKFEGYNFYAIDLPGHGITPCDNSAELKITYYAQYIDQFIIDHKLENIVLIGHGMGALASIMVRYLSPYKIDKLILISPYTPHLFYCSLLFKSIYLPNSFRGLMNREAALSYRVGPNLKNQLWINEKKQELYNIVNNREIYLDLMNNNLKLKNLITASSLYNNLDETVLIILGNYNNLMPYWKMKRYFAKRINTKQIIQFSNSGHYCWEEEPALYYKVLSKFMNLDKPNINKIIKDISINNQPVYDLNAAPNFEEHVVRNKDVDNILNKDVDNILNKDVDNILNLVDEYIESSKLSTKNNNIENTKLVTQPTPNYEEENNLTDFDREQVENFNSVNNSQNEYNNYNNSGRTWDDFTPAELGPDKVNIDDVIEYEKTAPIKPINVSHDNNYDAIDNAPLFNPEDDEDIPNKHHDSILKQLGASEDETNKFDENSDDWDDWDAAFKKRRNK